MHRSKVGHVRLSFCMVNGRDHPARTSCFLILPIDARGRDDLHPSPSLLARRHHSQSFLRLGIASLLRLPYPISIIIYHCGRYPLFLNKRDDVSCAATSISESPTNATAAQLPYWVAVYHPLVFESCSAIWTLPIKSLRENGF